MHESSASEGGIAENAARLDQALQFALRARANMLTDATATGHNKLKLETGDVDTLDQISGTGGSQMSEIAAGLHVDPSTVTRAVDRLVERGLVSRRRDPKDTRSIVVSFTTAGFEVLAEARERRIALAMRLLERFSADEQDAIGRLLPMVADAIVSELAHSGMDQ